MKITVGEYYIYENTIFRVVRESRGSLIGNTCKTYWDVEVLSGDKINWTLGDYFYEHSDIHTKCKKLNKLTKALYEV